VHDRHPGPLDDEAVGEQVGDELGDRGAAQPGPPGDLGARDDGLGAQGVDDPQPVEPAERLE
jgi:hypothetical protein